MNKLFVYQGNKITFRQGDRLMVNATEMAKVFGKSPKDFLRLDQTKDFIEVLSRKENLPIADLAQVIKGGSGEQGTWIHQKVALKFAAWLSPEFELWCFDRVEEILTEGVSVAGNDDRTVLRAIQILQQRLDLQSDQLTQAAPKVQYFDNVLQSTNTYTANQIAKELEMSGVSLNHFLHEQMVQYKQGGVWLLYAKHVGKGYTETRTTSFTRNDGSTGTSMLTVWTEAGRKFIHDLAKDRQRNKAA